MGVTGAVAADEVRLILQEFQNAGCTMESQHVPAIGLLVSEKTLNGQKTRNLRFPHVKDIPSLLKTSGSLAMPVMHYNTKNLETLYEQVVRVFGEICEPRLCTAIQLNTDWPDASHVARIKERFAGISIILQVSYKAMAGLPIQKIGEKAASYNDSIDYILIDPSKGRGIDFDIQHSTDLYHDIKSRMPECSIVFAGGLSGENAGDVLLKVIDRLKTTDFSIDAEGKLRDKLSDGFFGNDVLNIGKVRGYLQSAAEVLK